MRNSFTKVEVYKLAKEVKGFLRELEGTSIETRDKGKLYDIENKKKKLEELLIEFEPTIYEEYSMKTKYAYQNMIKLRKEYDRVVKEECYKEVIEDVKKKYEEAANKYEKTKEYRDRLKNALITLN